MLGFVVSFLLLHSFLRFRDGNLFRFIFFSFCFFLFFLEPQQSFHLKKKKMADFILIGNKKEEIEFAYHYAITSRKLTLRQLLEYHLPKFEKEKIHLFFTTQGYKDYLLKKVDALKEHYFLRFNHNPPLIQMKHMTPQRTFFLDESIAIRNNPVRLANFEKLPNYKKQPLVDHSKKVLSTLVLNPSYLLIEFLPFIDNENAVIDEMIKWVSELGIEQEYVDRFTSFGSYLKLKGRYETERSKLDSLLDFFQLQRRHTFDVVNKFQLKILKHGIVPNSSKLPAENGIYILRQNGVIISIIQSLIYDKIERWSFPDNADVGVIKNSYYDDNQYIYYNNVHKKHDKEYLLFQKTGDGVVSVESVSNIDDDGYLPMKKWEEGDPLRGISKLVYVYKRRRFPTERHQLNLFRFDPESDVKGIFHVKGLVIINFFF